MKHRYSITIDAPPERVFHWIDDAQRVMEWVPNIVENENLQVTENKVGTTFRQVYVENGRRIETKGVVTEYEPNRRLACEINGSDFDLHLDYRLEDLDGGTRLTQDSEIRFKRFFFKVASAIMAPFIRRSSRRQLVESFAVLKKLSESEDETPAAN